MLITAFIGVHAYIIQSMSKQIQSKCRTVTELAHSESWAEILNELEKIRDIWERHRMWASLTISTKEIEQIEMSLCRSAEYARLGEKSDFMGEFAAFSMLARQLPQSEGFHIEEIL